MISAQPLVLRKNLLDCGTIARIQALSDPLGHVGKGTVFSDYEQAYSDQEFRSQPIDGYCSAKDSHPG
jgi:hypothetical protein